MYRDYRKVWSFDQVQLEWQSVEIDVSIGTHVITWHFFSPTALYSFTSISFLLPAYIECIGANQT